MRRLLRRLARDDQGVAAVELALILPIVAALMLGAYTVWDAASRRQDMRASLNSGVEYYINGGTDDAVATQMLQSSWQRRPTDSSVTITRSCMCGTTPTACSNTCSGAAPSVYAELKLMSTDPATLMDQSLLESRVVRVR